MAGLSMPAGQHSEANRLVRVIADDLTGALDSGVQFTGIADLAVVLRAGAAEAAEADRSLALNLGCRDGSRGDAVAASLAAARVFDGADVAFKKIDSLLRGHWAAEIAAFARSRRFSAIVLAPAFPAQGRVTRNGTQLWRSSDGTWHAIVPDIIGALAAEGLSVGTALPCEPGHDVIVLDAETEEDLAGIAAAEAVGGGPVLWCGAAGLARALAGAPPRQISTGSGPRLVLIGSHHPVSQAQLSHLAEAAPAVLLRCDPDNFADVARIEEALAKHGRCVALAALPDGSDAAFAATQIDSWLHATLEALRPPATLTVVGGETLAAACHALEVARLDILGEIEPGVPCSRLVGGAWNSVLCISKSGAFGGPDWLRRHMR